MGVVREERVHTVVDQMERKEDWAGLLKMRYADTGRASDRLRDFLTCGEGYNKLSACVGDDQASAVVREANRRLWRLEDL